MLDIIDLSMHVVRDYFIPLACLWFVGCLPFFLADWFLIRWLADDYYDSDKILLFAYLACLLIVNQSQVATTFMTCYLGHAIFSERPSLWEAIRSAFKPGLTFLWVHGVLRMVIPVALLLILVGMTDDFDTAYFCAVWISIFALIGIFVRCIRPFANELICLERTPMRKKNNGPINYSLRSSSLHQAANSELLGRFFLVCILAPCFTLVVGGVLLAVDNILSLHSQIETLPVLIYGPIAGWIVAGFYAIVRLLSYIDIRIRQEGWEVELKLRAEALRLDKMLRESLA